VTPFGPAVDCCSTTGYAGIAVTPNGHVFVANTNTGTIAEWDATGAPVTTFTAADGVLLRARGQLAAFPDGQVGWVGVPSKKINPSTRVITDLPSYSEYSFETGQGGTYYDGDMYGNTWRYDGTSGVRTRGRATVFGPLPWLAFSSFDGLLLALDSNNGIQKFDATTMVAGAITNGVGAPTGMAADSQGYLYVAYGTDAPYTMRQYRISDMTQTGSFTIPDASARPAFPRIVGRTMYVSAYTRVWKIDIGVPVAAVSKSPSQALRGQTVTLDASGSYAPFGTITSYDWDLNGDGTYDRTTASASTTTTFDRAGSKTVRVRPTSTDGTDTATLTFDVQPVAPGAPTGATASAPSSSHTTVAFTAPTDDGGTAITDYVATCASTNGGTARSATASTSPITVANLSPGRRYVCSVAARGPGGTSAATDAPPIDNAAVSPSAPTSVTASLPLATTTAVSFSAPSDDGGSPVLDYTATCQGADGSRAQGTASASPVSVDGLVPGVTHTCTVVARNAGGMSPASVASGPILAFLAAPGGEVGISINDGAQYTTTPDVKLTVVWPARATGLRVANDGGFAGASRFELAQGVPWKLNSSGPERLPKTVYVRFSGSNVNEQQTFQDDIILDETPPVVISATASWVGGAMEAARAKTSGRAIRVRARAKDTQSGVRLAQVTSAKSKPGANLAFRGTITTKVTGNRAFLRVRDGAGNWSKWKTLAVR